MLNVKNIVRGLVIGMVVTVGCFVNGNTAKATTIQTINTSIVSVNIQDNKELDSIDINGNTYQFYGNGWHLGDLCTVTIDGDKITDAKKYVNDWLYNRSDTPTDFKLDQLINNGTIKIDQTNYTAYNDILKNMLYKDNNQAMTHYTQDGSWYIINEYNGTYGCYNSINNDEQYFKSEEDVIQYMKDNWQSCNGKMNR